MATSVTLYETGSLNKQSTISVALERVFQCVGAITYYFQAFGSIHGFWYFSALLIRQGTGLWAMPLAPNRFVRQLHIYYWGKTAKLLD